jgi:hypothetical protein
LVVSMTDNDSRQQAGPSADAYTGVGLLLRLRQRTPTADDLLKLAAAADEYLASGGALHLERCIAGLPATQHKLRLCMRDEALRQAMSELQRMESAAGAAELAVRWRRFVDRGTWARLRREPALPLNLPQLDRALFAATDKNGGYVLSEKQLGRIVSGRRHGRRLDVSCSAADSE